MKRYISIFKENLLTLIAYHGSPFDFEEFDISQAGKSNDPGDYGEGIYFDTNDDWAKSYARNGYLFKCELHLKKYIYINFKKYSDFKHDQDSGEIDKYAQNEELQKYIDTLRSVGIHVVENSGRYDKPGETINTFLSVSRRYGAKKIAQALKQHGYDGVVVDYGSTKEIVIFDTDAIEVLNKEKV